jgi:hypothetical protein
MDGVDEADFFIKTVTYVKDAITVARLARLAR